MCPLEAFASPACSGPQVLTERPAPWWRYTRFAGHHPGSSVAFWVWGSWPSLPLLLLPALAFAPPPPPSVAPLPRLLLPSLRRGEV